MIDLQWTLKRVEIGFRKCYHTTIGTIGKIDKKYILLIIIKKKLHILIYT